MTVNLKIAHDADLARTDLVEPTPIDWSGRPGANGLPQAVRQFLTYAAPGQGSIPVVAPFTGELVAEIPDCTPEDVKAAVARVRPVQNIWGSWPVAKRSAVLLRFHDLLLERREQGLDLIQLESGKARRHALEEILDTALVARHYGVHGPDYLKPKRHRGPIPFLTNTVEYYRPVGIVGVVAPWHFPLVLNVTDLLAALVAGNGVVLRSDPQSSLTALWALDLLYEAGLPRNIVEVVTGEGEALGAALLEAVDFMMFTGSAPAGRTVAKQAAERLIGCSLDLGGKNPMLVLDDADLDAAADGLVRSAFVGAGQAGFSIERVYVHASIYDRFVEAVVSRVANLKLGTDYAYGMDVGSLTVRGQLDVVEAHVADAVAKGARVLVGGRALPNIGPLFYAPTVLAGVKPSMRVFHEETFGPVVSLYAFNSIDEAVARANDSAYGLNASVWSADANKALAVAQRIRAGSVNINEGYAAAWASTSAPIGGQKQSGHGLRHGAEGLLKYTERQTIAVQRALPFVPSKYLDEKALEKLVVWLLGFMRQVPGLR